MSRPFHLTDCPSMDDLDPSGQVQAPKPRPRRVKPPTVNPTEELAAWFWTEILHADLAGRHTKPNYRRLLGQAAYITKTLNLCPSQVKTALQMMVDHGESPQTLSACYLFTEKTTGKSWYDYAENPWQDAPPWYDTCRYIWWLERYFPDDPDLKQFSVTPQKVGQPNLTDGTPMADSPSGDKNV